MPSRACDWFNQALRDLEQAKDSQQAGRHEWACFTAQQAAAKSAKALQLILGHRKRVYSILEIFREIQELIKITEDFIDKGMVLDNFYFPTRYPNNDSQGAPFEHFGSLQSETAINYAFEIVDFAEAYIT